MIRTWRITKRRHAQTAFSGTGAKKSGGRWNNPGTAVVYTAESQSLAALEMLVHLDRAELLLEYVLISVDIRESLLQDIDPTVPRTWKSDPPPALRRLGDEWVSSGKSVALRVPSTLVPDERNVLLNPAHADFGKLVIGEPLRFTFESRLTP